MGETLSVTLADQCATLVKKQGFVFVDAPPLTEPAVLANMQSALAQEKKKPVPYIDGRLGVVVPWTAWNGW